MSEITTVVLDAMGGDNAPAAMIDGAIDAISKEKNVKVILVGIEDVIRKGLEGKTYNPEQIEIVNATEVIETAEPPVHAIRRKKDCWQNQRCLPCAISSAYSNGKRSFSFD